MSDDWNNRLANDVLDAVWFLENDRDTKRKRSAAIAALIGIRPASELESMMGAQLLASHFAAIECYRRAMLPNQPFQGRNENLR